MEWKEKLLYEHSYPIAGIEARMALAHVHEQSPSYGFKWVIDGEKKWESMERPLFQVSDHSNLIVSPRELRELMYTPELENAYRLLLKTRQAEEKLKNSNIDHQSFLHDHDFCHLP